ncbi:hypothetical protein [Pleurocapsa sp. PCC 7319]|uniref:hypothetical protein n=1 Tax=Pleurocapsa sp. PCC 7319 TaxID=118161 RepID=UPI00034BDCB4|nr:hypothetical protein [Pleurocapsa sp. PCC 7319]
MELKINKIQALADSYCAQEMFAALMLKREFNNFNGRQVLTDLIKNQDLWLSFIFSYAVYYDDDLGYSYSKVAQTLVAMANQKNPALLDFVEYPVDTLYILTDKDNAKLSKLLEFKEKWQVDEFEVVESEDIIAAVSSKFNPTRRCLKEDLYGKDFSKRKDGTMVTYWWD